MSVDSITNQTTGVETADLKHTTTTATTQRHQSSSNEHPLHTIDMTVMKRFYEALVAKLEELNPKWKSQEWIHQQQQQHHHQHQMSENPFVFSEKQRVIDAFARFARESGEPMILLPSFDFGDVMSFERFLQLLKQDGLNAMRRYRNYLTNKDMRKYEIDLVIFHARYGIMLVECKECFDHLDTKRRGRARMQLTTARSCFDSIGRLLLEAKGAVGTEAQVPIMEFVALPNMHERPLNSQEILRQKKQQQPQQKEQQDLNSTTDSTTTAAGTTKFHRVVNFMCKSDLESSQSFGKWWQSFVVEQHTQHQQFLEHAKRPMTFDAQILNMMGGLISCVRHNSVMPVIYKENDDQEVVKVYAELFQKEHEECRAMPKCVVVSQDDEKLRKTLCLQILWLLLNEQQKKISVVCAEHNKPYYEDFFAQQRKLYAANLSHNLRFYTNLDACVPSSTTTTKKENEMWIFDAQVPNNGELKDVVQRVKDNQTSTFWIFTTQQHPHIDMEHVRTIHLDQHHHQHQENKPWINGPCHRQLKMPLRINCDMLVIGDIVSLADTKHMTRLMGVQSVPHMASQYGVQQQQHKQQQQLQLHFNPLKRFRTVKYLRGGSIENLKQSLQMHDSIKAPVVLLHVGDEDVFKTARGSPTAVVERVKELVHLVKEYCPESFVVVSTLLRRFSKSENQVIAEVNKGLVQMCKQTRETLNVHYMMNVDQVVFDGRSLNAKGLRYYVESFLFVIDYFMIKKNKQN